MAIDEKKINEITKEDIEKEAKRLKMERRKEMNKKRREAIREAQNKYWLNKAREKLESEID